MKPGHTAAHCNLGIAQLEAEMFDKAEKNIKKAMSLDPGNPFPHYNLAIVYLNKDMEKESIAEFKIAASMGREKAKKELEN